MTDAELAEKFSRQLCRKYNLPEHYWPIFSRSMSVQYLVLGERASEFWKEVLKVFGLHKNTP